MPPLGTTYLLSAEQGQAPAHSLIDLDLTDISDAFPAAAASLLSLRVYLA